MATAPLVIVTTRASREVGTRLSGAGTGVGHHTREVLL